MNNDEIVGACVNENSLRRPENNAQQLVHPEKKKAPAGKTILKTQLPSIVGVQNVSFPGCDKQKAVDFRRSWNPERTMALFFSWVGALKDHPGKDSKSNSWCWKCLSFPGFEKIALKLHTWCFLTKPPKFWKHWVQISVRKTYHIFAWHGVSQSTCCTVLYKYWLVGAFYSSTFWHREPVFIPAYSRSHRIWVFTRS